jgi:hypothetical protein
MAGWLASEMNWKIVLRANFQTKRVRIPNDGGRRRRLLVIFEN